MVTPEDMIKEQRAIEKQAMKKMKGKKKKTKLDLPLTLEFAMNRKQARNVARRNMKVEGLKKVNKRNYMRDQKGNVIHDSFFSLNWMRYAFNEK